MDVAMIKKKKRHGDYPRIAEMLGGKYAVRTVAAQLNGYRTLKDDVREAAERYYAALDKLNS